MRWLALLKVLQRPLPDNALKIVMRGLEKEEQGGGLIACFTRLAIIREYSEKRHFSAKNGNLSFKIMHLEAKNRLKAAIFDASLRLE